MKCNFIKYFSKLHIYTYSPHQIYYSAIKKEQNNAICSNIYEPIDSHTKWSKSDRERQIYDITYVLNLKNDTNELTYKTEID